MHRLLIVPLVVAVAAAVGSSQSLTLPASAATSEGSSSNSFPWGTVQSTFPGLRVQQVYDASHFSAQSVTGPILVHRARWRANGLPGTQSWVGGRFAVGTVRLSTCPIDYTAVSTTAPFSFAPQQGADSVDCYVGPVDFLPGVGSGIGVIGQTVVDITFDRPFLYDPALGDLVVDADHLCGANFTPNHPTATSLVQIDVQNASPAGARVFASTGYPAAGGAANPYGTVVTLDYAPATNLLFPSFSASVRGGASPTTVTFTDQSFTTDPGGVLTWAWDFDGDSLIDSTQQNPTHNYAACGDFTVSLTVTDATHGAVTTTRTGYISIDDVVADFSTTFLGTPNVFQLTDLSSPPATSWAWDFDGDNIVDSTQQNPVALLPPCQVASVKLTVTRNCKSDVITKEFIVASDSLTTTFAATAAASSGATWMFDVNVLNPGGINICALDLNSGSTAGAALTTEVYVTPTSYLGKDGDISQWRLVATGSGFTAGSDQPSHILLNSPVLLPVGNFGLAIRTTGGTGRYAGGTLSASNADVALTLGVSRSGLFSGTFNSARAWSGRLHYDTGATGGSPGMGWFGRGCAGTLPISQVTVISGPTLGGNLSLAFDNMPLQFGVAVVGFSKTLYQGTLPLPIDLGTIGAPGCTAHVSYDLDSFMFGSANVCTFTTPVPLSSTFLGLPFFVQTAVLDSVNAFGFVFSDAWAGRIGL